MSALILALIASICLAVVPQKITNEYENTDGVTHAATEVINGVTYEVIYLTGDSTDNRSKIAAANNAGGNYRYVLTADWDLDRNGVLSFNNGKIERIIFDLSGHTFIAGSYWGERDNYVTVQNCKFEITDSSVGGNGVWCSAKYTLMSITNADLTISGGNLHTGQMDCRGNVNVYVCGGKYNAGLANRDSGKVTVTTAPWMRTLLPWDGYNLATSAWDNYAVSITDLASGAYNYAYGYKWDITAAELDNLAIPTGKTYYLWGRDKDGWYHYLNLRYVNGAWQSIS